MKEHLIAPLIGHYLLRETDILVYSASRGSVRQRLRKDLRCGGRHVGPVYTERAAGVVVMRFPRLRELGRTHDQS